MIALFPGFLPGCVKSEANVCVRAYQWPVGHCISKAATAITRHDD